MYFASSTLLKCRLFLLDCDTALPLGKTGKSKSHDQAGGQTRGQDVAPSAGRAPAFGDEPGASTGSVIQFRYRPLDGRNHSAAVPRRALPSHLVAPADDASDA